MATTLTLQQPFTGSAPAGERQVFTVTLQAGHQYWIRLRDTDAGSFNPALRVYSGQASLEERGGLLQDAALGFFDARTRDNFIYFTPPADGVYEVDVTLAEASGFQLSIEDSGQAHNYVVAPQDQSALSFSASAANDLIELGNFGSYGVLTTPGAVTVSGGAGFDVLVADFIDVNEVALVNVTSQQDGLHLYGQFHPLTINGTPHAFDDSLTNVKLDSVEAVQFADRIVYTLSAAQAQIARLYEGALGRVPEIGGLAFQLNRLAIGHTAQEVARGFLQSPEFLAVHPQAQTDDQFIAMLYQNALHRAPEADGLAYWESVLGHGTSRETVLIGISSSPEAQQLWAPVVMQA